MAVGRERRQQGTRQQILDACWSLARTQGLTGFTLRQVAAEVGMRAPSLYTYFDSKHAMYDAMFEHGNAAFSEAMSAVPSHDDRAAQLRAAAAAYLGFCIADPVRHQLLFQRTVPGFVPSPQAYAPALAAYEAMRSGFAAIGIHDGEDLDLWTALLSGLAAQQLANDPGGERWTSLVDRAVEMYLDHIDRSTR